MCMVTALFCIWTCPLTKQRKVEALVSQGGGFTLHGANLGMFSGLDLAYLTWTFSTAVTLLAVSGPSIECVRACADVNVCVLGISQIFLPTYFPI